MGWFTGGSAAIVAVLIGIWGYARGVWGQIASRVIVSVDVFEDAAAAVLSYSNAHLTSSRFGNRAYTGWREYVRPRRIYERVAAETLGDGGKLFWRGWRPMWLTRTSSTGGSSNNDQCHMLNRPVRFTFLRGTFDPDQFVQTAIEYYNASCQDDNHSRYYVIHASGSAGKVQAARGNGSDGAIASSNTPVAVSNRQVTLDRRLLKWKVDDLGPATMGTTGSALDNMSLSDECMQLVEKIRRWYTRKDWFLQRGLPWKFGALFFGPPGTGKTAVVRAIGEDLNMPIYLFDLSTFYNDELHNQWTLMRANAPAIALIEDFDGVFLGRKPATEKIQLTFDCLLNCIEGVERMDGLLLIITTNHVESLDPALGGPDENGKMATRPGRIAQSVFMGPLTEAGRVKMAQRILMDWPSTWDELVAAGDGNTGDQFEKRCIAKAQELWFHEA